MSDIRIERKPGKVVVTLHTGRPGVVIGKKGAEVDKLRDELAQLTGKEVGINVEEIKRPELDAQLVARQHREAAGAAHLVPSRHEACGAERDAHGRAGHQDQVQAVVWAARKSRAWKATTRVVYPLHTLRADIDYATVTAKTTFGTIGVKVWIFKGEVVEDRRGKTYSTGA